MVGAISSTSLVSSVSTTSTGSSDIASQKAALQAQIADKNTELEDAKTDEDKQALEDEIAALETKLAAIEAAAAKKTETQRPAQTPEADTAASEQKDRIGTRNFADGEPFGSREMWV